MNTGRWIHTATLLASGQVMVAGGFNSNIGNVAGTETYNPATGNWTTNGDLINPRSDHTATLLPNGLVLVAGGDDFSGALTNAELFDPASGTWTATGSMTNSRTWHAAALLPNGNVLVAGGYDFVNGNVYPCELYNPASGTWTNTGSLNYGRIQFTATVLTNGLVLVVGGDGAGYCELYNPATGTWALTGTNLVPRQNHTATLLADGQVLIAGGSGDNTSELYNPVTGLWTNTGVMTVIRSLHTATLLPNGQVLVAGGHDVTGTNILSSTELYDPASGTWTTNLDMISLRAQQTATLLPNGNVLMAGGFDGTNGVALAELYVAPSLPPSPGMWTLTGSLANALYLHTATLLPNGKVLVAGGGDYSGNVFGTAQLYDPASGTWTGTNAMSKARYAHTATLLTNGKVLVAGGTTNQYDIAGGLVQTVELFNPTNSTWTTTGPLNFPRFFHTATLLANGKVLVTGGISSNSYPTTILTNSELYDPATGLWSITGPLHEARYNHTATLLPSGKVLVTGGQVTNAFLVTGSAELYDPVAGTWTATGSMPYPLANHTATLLPNGQVLVAGGDIDIGSPGGIGLYPVLFASLYDPATGLWTPTAAMHFVHDYHTATLLTNGLVLIAGGGAQFGSTTNCAELYEPSSQTWTAAATMNTPRQHHTATLLPNGQVLAVGGSGNSGLLASAELYNSISLAPIFLINPAKPPGGSFQFSFLHTAGSTNTVFATTNLALAFSNWDVLGTATEVSPGHFQFTDSQATNNSKRFYRVRSP